jgi:hypothetical protein
MIKAGWCALVLVLLWGVASAQDAATPLEQIGPTDGRAVRAVVEGQLAALAVENSVQAFSYASPAIRSQFNDAAAFTEMVRRSYPMLIRPASISFFGPLAGHGVVLQAVQFRDREGNFWRAIYELQRQPDNSWRINGCAVAPDQEPSTT